MKILGQTRGRISRFLQMLFRKRRSKIGIYGPPNAGKTTLANRIAKDWLGDSVGVVSEIPHETRRAFRKQDICITGSNGHSITIDIVDTPGVTTKIDYKDFLGPGLPRMTQLPGRGRQQRELPKRCTGFGKTSTG